MPRWTEPVENLRILEARRRWLAMMVESGRDDERCYLAREQLALEFVLDEIVACTDEYGADLEEAKRLVTDRPPSLSRKPRTERNAADRPRVEDQMHLDLVHIQQAFARSTRAEREKYNISPEQYLALSDLERSEIIATAPIWSPVHMFARLAAHPIEKPGDLPSNDNELN